MAIAKYRQVADRVRSEILSGALEPLEQLPTEHELSVAHGVSRGTVRTALAELNAEGLVRTAQGSGSYVASISPMTRYFSLSSFDDDMRAIGKVPSTIVLDVGSTLAGPDNPLKVEPGTELFHIRRLRVADGIAMAVEERLLPATLCPGLIDEDLAHQSIHWLLTVKHAIPLVRIEHVVDRQPSLAADSEILGLDAGSPVLVIERTTYTESPGQARYPAVWFRSVHRDEDPRIERNVP